MSTAIATRRLAAHVGPPGARCAPVRKCYVERRARVLAEGWFVVRFGDGTREAAHESRLRQPFRAISS